MLAGLLTFAVARFFAAARALAKDSGRAGGETELMASAMEEALGRLRAQEQAMKARAEASERLSGEIIASMTSGLLVVDADGRVRTLNPAGLEMLGMVSPSWDPSFREIRGAEALVVAIDECLRTGKAIVRRSIPLSRVGGASHLGVTVSPIRQDKGGTLGAICLFTDLTEVMELEEQLRLKDSLARLGELTAGIAHEFRNGLATIHGYGRLLDLEKLQPEYRPYVEGIRAETVALGEIVTNFLNFARPAELVLTPVDMRMTVERAADDIRADATVRGGEVTITGDFGEVLGDDVLLRQAFSNLCRNAIEACAGAGIVPAVRLVGVLDHAQAMQRISVVDNGPGVDPAVASRIFRPFVTTRARGTGLGLALVQKIVVTHNGRVSASNEAGGGARLTVTLPLWQH
jgi:nitrogen fixation/metabolism regulation signal transduction histidine kinase